MVQLPELARLRIVRIPEAEGDPIEIGQDVVNRIPVLRRAFIEADRAYAIADRIEENWVVPPVISLKDDEAEALISLGLQYQAMARYGPGCLHHQEKFYLLWIEGFRTGR
jgi:hypothetical protein